MIKDFGKMRDFPHRGVTGLCVPDAKDAYYKARDAYGRARKAYQTTYKELEAMTEEKNKYQNAYALSVENYDRLDATLQEEKTNTIVLKVLSEKQGKELESLEQIMQLHHAKCEQLAKQLELSEATLKETTQSLKVATEKYDQQLISKNHELEKSKHTIEEQDAQIQLLSKTNLALMQQIEDLKRGYSEKSKELENKFKEARLVDREEMLNFMDRISQLQNLSAASSRVSSQASSREGSPLNSPRH